MAAAEDAEGDRVIEVVSAGALYHRGGDWERKYWSCSRGKDRYPYPVGYHAVRHFTGISYAMEIQQGPRGPIFLVTSTEGDTAIGQTPDIAWKNFQKKTGAKVKNWQRRKSFPQRIDGAELFGFKNASIQRLLRELIVDSTGAVELNEPCEVTSEAGAHLVCKDASDVSEAEDPSVCLGMESGTPKRSIEPSQVENTLAVHYPDMLTAVDKCNVSTHKNTNEGDTVGRALLQDVSDSRCTLPLLEEVPKNAQSTSLDDNLGESSLVSSQQVGLSSGSYLNSEKSDIELAEKEVAKSMMSILLPQAIPLLMKSYKRKKFKHKNRENSTVSVKTVSAYNPSDSCCRGVTVPTIVGEGTNGNSSEMCDHGGSHHDKVKNGFANEDCRNDDLVVKLDEMNDYVADSFEDDAQILGDNTTKSMGNHHHYSEYVLSRGPNEKSKLLNGKSEVFEYQASVHNGKRAPDVVYNHENGQYMLSDSLVACLEDEFGGEDSSHPANYNQFNGDVKQFEQQFKELTAVIKNGSSVPVDVSYHKNTDNGSINVCAQAFARNGPGVSRNEECLANILPAPVHSNAHNDAVTSGKHDVSSTLNLPPACEAKSTLLVMRDGQHHTEVPAIDQKENRFHSVSYKCTKSDDNTSFHSENVEFVDKHVAFESPDNGMYSSDGSQRAITTEGWPAGDGVKADEENLLGKVEECQIRYKNGNKNTILSVYGEGNVCEHIPTKGENDVFHHQPSHALSTTNCTHGLVSEDRTQARPDHHLELVGCYLHPMPVLSVMLNTKNHNSLYIYVLCGLLESCQRFLYVYSINPKDQKDVSPCFVGYTPLVLPTLDHSSTGNFCSFQFLFGRSGLHFTPDGQFLVLLSSIKIPSCRLNILIDRMQNIDCLCPVCNLCQCEDNSLKIVSVNSGYASLVTNLMPYGTVSCILIFEPNYIVAIEDSRNLHIWEMVDGWSEISEQYMIPSLGNMGPILELTRMPKNTSLIIGHDGEGGFCLWYV
ncbi:DNA binding [Zea mays]|uniref:DNA binding n=1 Tax=Zea mays TaxID=4577 RepID=A0A1D6ELP4_MAIZE|nr:DNA binding [Zea mays]